mmetsp:Transcript_20351/g.45949  ORF Transcript_20351/g.45949 Transcript_20351/m.45949 type:complete len:88 (-) Transcript_20351:36-299(-)
MMASSPLPKNRIPPSSDVDEHDVSLNERAAVRLAKMRPPSTCVNALVLERMATRLKRAPSVISPHGAILDAPHYATCNSSSLHGNFV